MTLISISWYLCVLFAVALAISSAITVVPDAPAGMRALMAVWLALSILFAAAAVSLKLWHAPQSKWLLRLFQCFAVLATFAVLMMLGG